MLMKRFVGFTALGLALALHATGALADDITVTNIAMPYEEILTINSPIGPTEGYVGQLVLTTSTGATIDGWCVDLFHDGRLGNQDSAYAVEPIATDNNGNPLTTAQIDEIGGLVVYGNDLLAAGGPATELDQDSAAVQVAIWSVEYANFSYSAGSSGLANQATLLVNEANAGDFSGYAIELEGLAGQQSYAAVPEPSSLALFGAALLGLLGRRRKGGAALPPRPAVRSA
jgi:hypothetical protein